MSSIEDTDNDKTVNVASRFPVDLVEKLDELCRSKYRGVARSQAIRWLVEDAYQEWEKEIIKS